MNSLAGDDSFAVLAAIGGLQLLPQNVQQLFELKIAACMIAAEAPRAGRAPTPARLKGLLHKSPVYEPLPHQIPNLLTGAMTYTTGSHTVFPGWEEDSDWVASRLLEAVELVDDARLRDSAEALAGAVFRISDAIAARAGLARHEGGRVRPLQPTEVPGYARLKDLANAVKFTPEEMGQSVSPQWGETLAPLISELPLKVMGGEEKWDFLASSLGWRPLVLDRDGNLIIAIPGDLLVGMRHAVICTAIELGVEVSLQEAFNRIVVERTQKALAGLGHVAFRPVPAVANSFPHTSLVFPIDTDKLMHLTLLGEDLSAYDRNNPIAKLGSLPGRRELENHFTEAERELLNTEEPPNEVLHLVVAQTMGRPFDLIVDQPQPPMVSPRVVLTTAELEVIATLEDPDLLLLWQFGRSVAMLRAAVPLKPVSQLDEFMEWRNSDYSFASLVVRTADADKEVLLLPGSAKELREEALKRLDPHGVRGPEGGFVEVERYLEDERVGLYKPRGRLAPPHFMVSVFGEGNLWVLAEDLDDYPPNWEEIRRWTELVAYWLWKLRPHLDELYAAVASKEIPAVVGVSLHRSFFATNLGPFSVETASERRVHVVINTEEAESAFGGTSNTSEERLIAEVLTALALSVGCEKLDLARALAITAEEMPPEIRKLVLFRHADPAVRPITMPPRLSKPTAVDELMHGVGRQVAEKLGLEPGPISIENIHRVLNVAVKILFERLERTVQSLQGDRLLEWIVTANEALVHHGVIRSLDLGSEVACYGPEVEVVERRLKQRGEHATATVSNRFLIEYVAARPPSGLRPISYAVYDLLMAQSCQIVELGTLSDLIKYELAEVEAVLLPTGRLAAWPAEGHRIAQQTFGGQVASGDVRRSVAWVDAQLAGPEVSGVDAPTPSEGQLEAGFMAEFGFGFGDAVRGLYSLCDAGMESTGCVSVPTTEAAEVIVDEIGGDLPTARRLIEAFSLRPRPEFFPAPDEFSKEDLYPWRFNRRLSYLRRPLLLQEDELTYGPAGVFRAIEYLDDLISQGRMWAQTKELKAAISTTQARRGSEFNDRVANLYAGLPDCWCQARVKKIHGLRIEREPGQSLGDVDVLVINPALRMILAIETKALAVALTPHQLHNEIRETFDPSEHSALTRHQERCDWLNAHRNEVLAHAEITEDDPNRWKTSALIVVDEEVFSPLLASVSMPIRPWQELVALIPEGKML